MIKRGEKRQKQILENLVLEKKRKDNHRKEKQK
jgi:hypothetical protein